MCFRDFRALRRVALQRFVGDCGLGFMGLGCKG